MRILIAPDKYKGSCSSMQVAQAINEGIKQFDPKIECTIHPLADGGDGSLAILDYHLHLDKKEIQVKNALGETIASSYYYKDHTAYIELASSSGLASLSTDDYNPGRCSTIGCGQMIQDAISNGHNIIYLFLGGSSTNDAAIGIASQLGFEFLDIDDSKLKPIGDNLAKVQKIINKSFISGDVNIKCICDVENPFYGDNGAAMIYAGQKGADKKQVLQLDAGMKHFAAILKVYSGKNITDLPGAGAAGGIAGGLHALIGADIVSGTEFIFDQTNFEEQVSSHDLIFSGEGRIDTQSLQGKLIQGVAKVAKQHTKPLALLAGRCTLSQKEADQLDAICIDTVRSLAKSNEDSIQNATGYLQRLGRDVLRIFY